MKNKSTITFICTAIMTMTCINSNADSSQLQRNKLEYYSQINRNGASVPIGYFLLIRKDNDTCAIRFTNYKISGGGYMSYSTGGYSLGNGQGESRATAEYDYFHQNDGSGNFKNQSVDVGHAKLAYARGTWSLQDQTDTAMIKCGPSKLMWDGLVGVSFSLEPGGGLHDETAELAVTKWKDSISEVNFNDPKVKWYRYKTAPRFGELIPVEKLW
jgi:hypothetical protein